MILGCKTSTLFCLIKNLTEVDPCAQTRDSRYVENSLYDVPYKDERIGDCLAIIDDWVS
jgi:hypothetical protein